jgi:RNA polymerase sigma-70 factor (ECF subfamily)
MAADAELLAAWRAGDAAAGEDLFTRHFDALYRFFRNKADDGIDDLIQATFLAAVASRDAFRGDASFRSYLFAIARNELYAHWRRRARRDAEADIGELSVEDLGTRPSGVLARHREQQLLLRALRAIPLDLQLVVELHYWEELTGPELAVALEVPEGTARSRLRRAREALEAAMRRLADDPATLASSIGDLDRWASSLRACVLAPAA